MGKFPRNYGTYGPSGRQPEEFEMTSEMLEKLTNNMRWKLWPTAEDGDASTTSPTNTSTSSNKENDGAGLVNEEIGGEVTVNDVSSLLLNMRLKAGISAMTDVVDSTSGAKSLLLEPGLKDQYHHIQEIKEKKKKKYSREFLLLIREEIEKAQKPFTGKIECPTVIRGNNDERTVTIPRRGQNLRQQQQQYGENISSFNNGVPNALHDHHYYYSSMNGFGNGNRNRNGFSHNNNYYQQTDNNNHRYFGGGRQRRNSSESSTGSNSNNNPNNKTSKIPSLLSTPILKPPSVSSTTNGTNSFTNRILRDSTQTKAVNSRGGNIMEPVDLKKPNTEKDIADILQKNQVKSILKLKVIKN